MLNRLQHHYIENVSFIILVLLISNSNGKQFNIDDPNKRKSSTRIGNIVFHSYVKHVLDLLRNLNIEISLYELLTLILLDPLKYKSNSTDWFQLDIMLKFVNGLLLILEKSIGTYPESKLKLLLKA